MKDFLITSTLCLFTFLAVYHLFLEREKMHCFNRFYLLLSIVISFVIPFVTIEIIREIPQQFSQVEVFDSGMPTTAIIEQKIDYLPWILGFVYGLVTLILVVRFGKNIVLMFTKMKAGKVVPFENSTLVLLEENTLPHTFLNTIFINETDYNNRNIETELFAHELTHVTQKHTLDVLFIETLKTIFWFNPVFSFYKKAIQLNHEFLADEKVVESYNDIPFYQSLLLSKINTSQTYYLASNLNYLITKKRLIMMTKTTSRLKSALYKLALIPILTALVFFLCVKITAQTKPYLSADNITEKPSDNARDQYYAGVRVIAKNTDGKILIDKKYEDLTTEEKERFLFYVPKKAEKKSPTPKQLEELKKVSKHAIWIDGLHVSNLKLNEYKAADFAALRTSSVYKNARSAKFPQPFQSQLYTDAYFEKNIKHSHNKFSGDKIEIVMGSYDKAKQSTSGKEKKKANSIKPLPIGNKEIINKKPNANSNLQDDLIYNNVEVKPEFPGGLQEFYKYILANFKIPAELKESGKIYAQFIVEKDGSLSNIKVLRELGFGTGKETARVLGESPKWKPGLQNGKTVRVLYTLPISVNVDKK